MNAISRYTVTKCTAARCTVVLACLLSSLAYADAPKLSHLYDRYLVSSPTQQPMGIPELAQQLKNIDVVFIGEYHGNPASHLLQAELQAALYRLRPQQVLSLEQFNFDTQMTVDAYLKGRIGEQELIDEAKAWDNYKASYRPLVEFAKQHQLAVVAANAPADWVRCVGRQGEGYLNKLTDIERQQLPIDPFYSTPEYQQKFLGVMHGGRSGDTAMASTMSRRFAAQLLRDNSMASRIVAAKTTYPNHQVIHLNGTFHSESHFGSVASVKRIAPQLKIAVISPIQIGLDQSIAAATTDQLALGDYVYFIANQPNDFVDPQKRLVAMQARFAKADQAAQSCR